MQTQEKSSVREEIDKLRMRVGNMVEQRENYIQWDKNRKCYCNDPKCILSRKGE